MSPLFHTLLAVTLISLLSLAAVVTLAMQQATLSRVMTALIAFAAGTMLGAAFLHLIPESLESLGNGHVYVLAGIVAFFLIERAIHWHHCTENHCIAPYGYLNLLGDAAHNFVDGVIVAAAFLTSPGVGLIAAVAIAMHELPQELGDFAVLVHSGFTPRRAIWLNFLTACTAILGGLTGYLALAAIEGLVPYVLAVSAGGLVYVAVADLMPELHKERKASRIVAHTLSLFLGIGLIMGFGQVAPHGGHAHQGPSRPHEHHDAAPGEHGGLTEQLDTLQQRTDNHGQVPGDRHRRLHRLRHLSGDLPRGLSGERRGGPCGGDQPHRLPGGQDSGGHRLLPGAVHLLG
mgnify:CR=1 FL=1